MNELMLDSPCVYPHVTKKRFVDDRAIWLLCAIERHV